jgi:hypothetical protein
MGELLTPTNFWVFLVTSITIAELFGCGGVAFATFALPFLWAKFFAKDTGKKDPLDAVVLLCAVILGIGAVCSHFGYGRHILGTYTALFGAAWACSPRRTFPTGEVRKTGF